MSLFKACIVLGILTAAWSERLGAAELREALMLEGTACWEDRDSIRQALLKLSGVKAVDAQSVPGYLLVDVVAGMVTSDELSDAVSAADGVKGHCWAEPMQSCISPGGHHLPEHETSRTASQK